MHIVKNGTFITHGKYITSRTAPDATETIGSCAGQKTPEVAIIVKDGAISTTANTLVAELPQRSRRSLVVPLVRGLQVLPS